MITLGLTGKECKKDPCPGCINCVGFLGTIYEKVKRSIHNKILEKIYLYISPSKYFAEYISEAHFIKKIKVVNLGIELKSYQKINNFDNLLYIGRITEDKGIFILIKAFSDLLKAFPSVKLRIVGEGNDIGSCIDYAKFLNTSDHIEFLGKKSEKEIEVLIKNSTLVVIPSIFPDNFPVVALEALSYCRPVVASNIGGIPEIVNDSINGYLVKPNDSVILEKMLSKLLRNTKLLTKLSENCKSEIKQFEIVQHVNKIIEIYEALT